MSNQLQRQDHPVAEWLMNPATKEQMRAALPAHLSPERMVRLALTAFRTNPGLSKCSPPSVMGAIMTASQLGLEPHVLGSCYLVPHGSECTLIVGYQGLLQLIRRSGEIASISARVVYDSDLFEVALESTPPFRHHPNLRRKSGDPIIGVYCHAVLASGEHLFEWMAKEDVEAIRTRARAGKSGPWATDWAEMARKTVLRRAAKYLPRSVSMADALELADRAEAPMYQPERVKVEAVPVAIGGARMVPPPPPAVVPNEDEAAPIVEETETVAEASDADGGFPWE
jgi:recombination protein RecT